MLFTAIHLFYLMQFEPDTRGFQAYKDIYLNDLL